MDVAWVPSWEVRLALSLDGLAALYALLATGIGFAVLVYSSRYLPLHLEHEGRPGSDAPRFYFFVLLFMGSMVGLAMAQDLILVFVFWDLTSIASYYLIGYDGHKGESRASALMALLVTGITAVLLLVGALLLYAEHGTFSVPELARMVEPGPLLTAAGFLIVVAGLAKSAQAPLHFWLPRAMAAPTPVSAYLHSAAMVAAGVLLIGRVYPLLQKSEPLLDALLVFGIASMAVGGVLALTRDALKQLLAYSTIAQYGFVVTMYGLGGPYGAGGAAYYVIVHAIAKSALFLTAGAVTEATGQDRLSKLGGLRGSMPLLAVSSGLAAATLTSLPLTLGFFADEFFFAAALERGPVLVGLAVASAATTLAYTWRFWSGLFLGEVRAVARRIPRLLIAPVVALGATGLIGGFFTGPFEGLAEAAGEVSLAAPTPLDATYHPEILPEYVMAAGAYALGTVFILTRPVWTRAALGVSKLGKIAGPERVYGLVVHRLNLFSDFVHRLEIRNLRGRVAAVLLPTAVLVGASVLATPTSGAYHVGPLRVEEAPLILVMLAVAVAAITTTFTRRHVTLALVLSSAGFALAVAYAFYGAPSVTLVAVLVETLLTVLLVATLKLIPYEVLHRQAELPLARTRRDVFVSVAAGAFAFVVVWGALSQPPAGQTVAEDHVRLAPQAQAKNVVTAILADFRGLDTLGEITVIALVLLGVGTLLGGVRPEALPADSGPPGTSGSTRPAARAVTQEVARLLYLPTLVVAAAILVKGFVQTGDGFSAGVVGALGVLLRYLAFGHEEAKRLPPVRHATAIAFSGLLVALGVAAFPLFAGEAVLTHSPPPGTEPVHLGTLELMTAVLFDFGVFLLVFGFAVGASSFFARASEASGAWGDGPR
ncbi:MAG TPA: hydrogen gas-evolving membrane-bound hydrogenase subunit E [Rubrobacteraceae bacterium]|nr:hydrogen gas-evolving membrane-bound hydrogenase subunit E [Rubrobacteraceae bacterium]